MCYLSLPVATINTDTRPTQSVISLTCIDVTGTAAWFNHILYKYVICNTLIKQTFTKTNIYFYGKSIHRDIIMINQEVWMLMLLSINTLRA